MAQPLSRIILATGAAAMAVLPLMAGSASAQQAGSYSDYPPPPPQQGYRAPPPPPGDQEGEDQGPPPGYYDQNAPQGYNQQGYNQQGYDQRGYNQQPPQGYAPNGTTTTLSVQVQSYDQGPPPGYDGTRPPPPPPGYSPAAIDQAQAERDARYAADAEAWARDNCVKARSNATAGAVIGGIFGALVGNGLSSRHDGGFGTLAGAAVGAVGGAAIGGSTANQTSPGCPPGFVVRSGAAPYSYDTVYFSNYYYAAPGWYRPWVYVGDRWTYRPYPYHDYYYRAYRPYHPNGWGNRGYYGRPGYYRRPYGHQGYRHF
ncbi:MULTISPECIES: hypothetical protein [unclassified Novosphingobium]|uniref:hypothetical protein n=1 Tax=unclassified Novosphingobium TaxID=2644732 RepID=UPI001493FB96|nr:MULTISPECIES: hypothetical protein [unclassified Novosphingobium]MBB3358063.1 hypothetical protein [Novosphingobium sp. BK256]MBB3374424.1 hypothetical protein [Novosphingobium sp. BK280]MBB3378836.1 hypothetical protein [Novosphingobium sp. BK258]MBB3420530.1 hypothetical protein [Novosphingobium sp. BK267]MBB3448348.1 hypothetical protein [Novosphingobium sp. BK352]